MNIQVEVLGTPVPQGSKRAFIAGGRAVVVDVKHEALRTYREAIAYAVKEKIETPLRGPISLRLDFAFPRLRSHFGKKGVLPSAPFRKTTKPDIDKCVRAVLDALTGIAYLDDAQVVDVHASKVWSEYPATYVLVEWTE